MFYSFKSFFTDNLLKEEVSYGNPSNIWIDKKGNKIDIDKMSIKDIKHYMKLVGKDSSWYIKFLEELKSRK